MENSPSIPLDQELYIHPSEELPTAAAILRFELVPIPEIELNPEALAEAAERVEDFLEANGPLFAASHDAWDMVKAVQEGAYEANEDHTRAAVTGTNAGRYTLRKIRRELDRSQDSRARTLLGSLSNMALVNFIKHVQPELPNIKDAESRYEHAESMIDTLREGYPDIYKKQNTPVELQTQATHLLDTYTRAHYADYEAMRATRGFLSQGVVVVPFVERIQELSALGRKGIVEFPGMLELFAAHHKVSGDSNSPFSFHLNRVMGRPKHYAAEFLNAALEPASLDEESRKALLSRKELSTALGFIGLIGDKILDNRADLIAQLAPYWKEWPSTATDALEVYTKGKVQASHTALKKSFEPFVRRGRLPATGNKVVVDARNKTVRQARGNIAKEKVTLTASKNQDMTDLTTPEVTRQPITKFGWLAKTGSTTKQNVLRVNMMEGDDAIGAFFQIKHVRDFLGKYQHHVSEDTIRDVLTLIATHPNPIKAPFSDRWEGPPYYLETPTAEGDASIKAKRRHLHRASLRDTPGTVRNETTRKTRLAYDIVDMHGELAILMYGIFIKQDIERINTLPIR